jgi:4-hydroxybenzoate polyprenyltransferase
MEIIRNHQLNTRLSGPAWLRPYRPALASILSVAILTLLAARPHFAWDIIGLIIGAFAVMQFSLALLSNYCDLGPDEQSQPENSIRRAFAAPLAALITATNLALLMAAILLQLPPLTWIVSLCYLALGLVYNLRLKSTPYGILALALAVPLIPLYAFAGEGRTFHTAPLLFWLVPVGFLLGVVLNLANSLPTIEEDSASGAPRLSVLLGLKRSFMACQLLIVASATLIGFLTITGLSPAQPWILVITLTLVCLGIEAMLLFFGPDQPAETRGLYFYVVALICTVLAGGWLLGVIAL